MLAEALDAMHPRKTFAKELPVRAPRELRLVRAIYVTVLFEAAQQAGSRSLSRH